MIYEVQLSSRYALQDQPRETPGTRADLTHDRVWPQVGERGCFEQRPGGIPAQRGLFEIVYVHPQSAGSSGTSSRRQTMRPLAGAFSHNPSCVRVCRKNSGMPIPLEMTMPKLGLAISACAE